LVVLVISAVATMLTNKISAQRYDALASRHIERNFESNASHQLELLSELEALIEMGEQAEALALLRDDRENLRFMLSGCPSERCKQLHIEHFGESEF
tara:strand:- start:24 stop:314 length:291 start_codon:yes stop_codon:yes gene_type:complete